MRRPAAARHVTTLGAVLSAALAATACGDDGGGGSGVDAGGDLDDAAPDGSPPITCQHDEIDDAGNDETAEATGLVAGGAALRICGWIDPRAPEGAIVDVDRFAFAVDGGGPFLVRIEAPVGNELTALAGAVRVADGDGLRGDGLFVGDHAVFAATLEDGEFVVEVVATDDTAPAGPIPYEIVILPDDPDERCGAEPGAAAYVEGNDGATNIDNDVVLVVWEPTFSTSFTPLPTDEPEASGSALVISSGQRYRVTGTAGVNANALADAYQDRDTYVLYTGGQANELSVRLTWDGDDADLDWLLLPVPGGDPPRPISAGATIASEGPELDTTAVLPSTSYWLWVGSFDGSAEPTPYELTICGARYAR